MATENLSPLFILTSYGQAEALAYKTHSEKGKKKESNRK